MNVAFDRFEFSRCLGRPVKQDERRLEAIPIERADEREQLRFGAGPAQVVDDETDADGTVANCGADLCRSFEKGLGHRSTSGSVRTAAKSLP